MDTAEMGINELVQLVTQFGWPVVLVGFFVWLSWKREERTSGRMDTLSDFIATDLHTTTKEATAALHMSTEAIQRCEKSHEQTSLDVRQMCAVMSDTNRNIKEWMDMMHTRPCLLHKDFPKDNET